jgi:hypothetical protein
VPEIFAHLLEAPSARAAADDVSSWWARWSTDPCSRWRPIDAALAGGLAADRLGFAFAAGYHAALRALVPELSSDHLVALCATEEGGAHPRRIRSSLTPDGAGYRLSGKKRWSTLAPHARELLVFASLGTDETGRNRLRIARVAADAPGVTITPMPQTPFAPEIPHAEIEFDAVRVEPHALFEGDAWERWVKPFRTVEDLHVHAALLGYLLGVARRHRFPRTDVERLLALVAATRSLAEAPTDEPGALLAVAGVLGETARAVADLEPRWQGVDPAESARWQRDRGLLEVAGAARSARTERAWQRVPGVGKH